MILEIDPEAMPRPTDSTSSRLTPIGVILSERSGIELRSSAAGGI